jgi:hypothetical protein
MEGDWIPAFAGMTMGSGNDSIQRDCFVVLQPKDFLAMTGGWEEIPGAGGGKRLPDGLAYLLGIMI